MRLRLEYRNYGEVRLVILPDGRPRAGAWQAPATPLVYSSEFAELTTVVCDVPAVGYGRISAGTSFGRAAKVAVKSAAAVIDTYSRDRSVFLTGTLPGSTPAAVAALAGWSAWVVKNLRQWLRDTFPQSVAVGVWEYQKRGALHLHLVVLLADAEQAQEILQCWKTRWIKLLKTVSKKSGVDLFARADGGSWASCPDVVNAVAEPVRKSVKHYLAKYLSKGSDTTRGTAAYPPSRWWFCDRRLLQEARESCRQVEVLDLGLFSALTLFEKLGSLAPALTQKIFPYCSPVDMRCRGIVCCADGEVAADLFHQMLSVLSLIAPIHAAFRGCVVNTTHWLQHFWGPGARVYSLP